MLGGDGLQAGGHPHLATFVLQADSNNCAIRRVNISTGLVTTLAGSLLSSGHADGIGTAATFSYPWAVAIYANGSLATI